MMCSSNNRSSFCEFCQKAKTELFKYYSNIIESIVLFTNFAMIIFFRGGIVPNTNYQQDTILN